MPRHSALALALALVLAGTGPTAAGGDAATDLASAVEGTWRSLDDPKSVRVFAADGTAEERYGGETLFEGAWEIADTCPAAPSEANEPVLVVRDAGDPAPFCYGILEAGPERLDLLYLPRGNRLRYGRVGGP